MGQFKGTPGPWTGKDVGICKQDDVGLQLGFIMSFNDERITECAANARLIAAAPELLEALQFCEEFMSLLPSTGFDGLARIEAARAAINKALGETK